MRLIFLLSTFCLLLFFNIVQSIPPQLVAAASTPPLALSASSSPNPNPSSTITFTPGPDITPPPSPDDVNLDLEEKWHLTTFWTCITIATQSHCGWREPVLPGGDEIAAAPRFANRKMAGMAGGALLVAGWIL